MYMIRLMAMAQKDAVKIERAGLKNKVGEIIKTVARNPLEPSQQFEKLKGTRIPIYTRRINVRHRFVYEIQSNTEGLSDPVGKLYEGIVKVVSMWNHHE